MNNQDKGRAIIGGFLLALIAFVYHQFANAEALILGDQACYFSPVAENAGVKKDCAIGRELARLDLPEADRLFLWFDYYEKKDLKRKLKKYPGIVFCVMPEDPQSREAVRSECLHTIEPTLKNGLAGMIKRRSK